ncbi:translocation/assembly module TamB [Sphingobacterium gobiense]|uniref:Translocation/assembly module TamB n=2 Tax=Sphingobacterium gobiense TaxID=1382456 RepID=A0A2S9JVA7_9SPHI|nr:translocation/assembly module TamB [Sphingobacterium gobiense]
MNRFGRIALKTILWVIGSIIALLLLIIFLIRMPAVQNYVVGKVTNYLENKIGTRVDIGYVNITFPKKIVLENVYFEDQSKDTLIAGEKLLVDINMFKLLKNTVEVQQLELKGITAKINRTLPDSSFNFDYIIEAFMSEDESTADVDTTSALVFDINDVLFEHIHFVYHDDIIGTSADVRLQHFDTKVKRFDLTNNMAFSMPTIRLDGLTALVKQWAPIGEGEAPSADDFGITDASVAESSLLPDLEIKNLNLSNILVEYQDSSTAMDTRFDIRQLTADIKEIDLNNEIVRLGEINLDGSDSQVLFGNSTSKPIVAAETDTTSNNDSMNWVVSADRLTIDKTNVWFKDDNEPRMNGFDYFNIKISDLLAELDDLYYSSDSISGSLKNLSMADHSGFSIKQLQGDFVYHNSGVEIQNFIAQTPKTTIRDYIKLTYPSLDAATEDPSQVFVEANIKNSTLDMGDIRYFVPDLDTMEAMKPLLTRSFYINGSVRGQMDNLTIPNIEVRTLDRTHLVASAHIRGLPDTEKLYIDLNLKKFTTGRADIERLVAKSLMPDSLQLPNAISLSGTLKGGMSGFDANMSLVTEKGNATVNGNMQMDADTTYNAYVSIDNLNIGNILGQDSVLGIISAEANVVGTGLDPKNMNAAVDGRLNHLDAMGYTYRNIQLQVDAKDGDIMGTLNSPDPNIQFNMDFVADMRNRYPKVQATLMIDSVNFQNLKLMEDDFRYHGKIVADFETADPDFLNGSIVISNSSLAYNDARYTLDSISLVASADTSRNTLILKSEFLQAHMVGKYQLTALSSAVQDVIQIYYNPNSTPKDTISYAPQHFEFSGTINNSRFIRDFFPDLEEMRDITLDGTFNSATQNFMAKLIAPKIVYGGTTIEDVGVDLTTFDSTLYYSALIHLIKMGDIELNNTVASGSVVENNVDLGLWIKDKEDKEQYHLGAGLRAEENNFIFSLHEDGLKLNYEDWHIDTTNTISFGESGVHARNFRLMNNGQELLVQSRDSIPNAPIDVTFNNFRIETFTQMLESEILDLGGGINGTATISRLESNPVFVSDLTIDRFFFGKDTVGNILIKVDNIKENTFSADVKIEGNGNDVQLIGDFISPPDGNASLNATLSLKPMKMTTIQAFSLGYLEDCAGDLVGELKITGTIDAPKINGGLTFQNGKLNVAMLNADFLMDNQTVHFNNQGIQFKKFEIKDLRGNSTLLNGSIATTTYTDFSFNLNLTMNDFAAVNSTREDNDLFFGKLYLTSNLRIRGNLDQPRVDGDIKVNENTDFVFIVPNDDPGIAQRDGVVKFVNRSDTARANVFAQLDSITTATQLSGMDIALNLSTDAEAKFKVILDEGTQDALNIQGVAELNATIDASDKITMSGTYTVEKGDYTFSLGPISKPFLFQKGSTITWNGDPLDARMDITAIYRNRFPTLELVQSQLGGESPNLYKQRIPFDVKLILTGELFKPEINFDIDLDENNAIVSQDVVSKVNIALANIRDDPAELNKQVFSLIALGRFMSANPFESLSGGGGAEAMARNTVSSFLSSQLNNLASDLIKGVELDFNLQSEEDYLTGNAQTRTDLNVGVSKMLFDDRLKITIGSNFEVEGNTRPGEKASNIAGDISLDYQLSKDGRYFARVYRKNQYQATLQGQFVETGIGFIITMSYDKFKELFMSSSALDQYYNTDSRSFRRRFDIERMETDSAYRDSVRLVIRDSLMKNSPEFRKRIEERQKNERLQRQENRTDSSRTDKPVGAVTPPTAIRDDEEERRSYDD